MNPDVFLKAVFKALLLPPMVFVLVALVAIIALKGAPRLLRRLAISCLTLTLVLSMPAVPLSLQRVMGVPGALSQEQASRAGAIVVLSSGVRLDAPEYGGDTLTARTLERVRYGATLARRTGLPLLVSGGHPQGGTPEAVLMRNTLENEFGVPVRWVEAASDNTHENAVFSAAMLRRAGIERVVLVTHAFDMRRAAAEFATAGMSVIPAPTNVTSPHGVRPLDWVPSVSGFTLSYYTMYEIAGDAVRVITEPLRRRPAHAAP